MDRNRHNVGDGSGKSSPNIIIGLKSKRINTREELALNWKIKLTAQRSKYQEGEKKKKSCLVKNSVLWDLRQKLII